MPTQFDHSAIFTPRAELMEGEPSTMLMRTWQASAIDQYNPVGDRQAQTRHLNEVVDQALQGTAHPDRRDALQMVGDITRYMWFGTDTTPPPKGLVSTTIGDAPEPWVIIDPEYICITTMEEARRALLPLGLGQLAAHRQVLVERQADSLVHPVLRGMIANTPGYRLLESFLTVQHEWHERPLTPAERELELQIARQRIRHHHALPDDFHLDGHPGAKQDVRRANRRIEEQTRYAQQPKHEEQSPAARARQFFYELAVNELGKTARGTRVDRITTVGDSSVLISGPGFRDRHSATNFPTWAQYQGYVPLASRDYANSETELMLEAAALQLFDPAKADLAYDEILAAILESRLEVNAQRLKDFSTNLSVRLFGRLATLLTAPAVASRAYRSYIVVGGAPSVPFAQNHMLSRQEYREGARQTVGTILERPAHDSASRILYYPTLPLGLPTTSDEATLRMQLAQLPENAGLGIYGYELVSHQPETHIFGFRATPEADPYVECRVPIPEAARQTLANTYANMGLRELATIVAGTPDLTVDRLANAIAITNRYVLPTNRRAFVVPDTLEGFATYVHDGRLPMQCVGSSHFLEKSLQQAFGTNSAYTVSGNVLRPYIRRIFATSHRQTAFVDPETNRLYILDATSRGAFDISMIRDMFSTYAGYLRDQFRKSSIKPFQAPPAPHTTIAEPITPEASPLSPQEVQAESYARNRDSLIMQLRMIYGSNGRLLDAQTLLETITKQHSNDLVFRVLSTVMIANRPESDPHEATHLLGYLAALRQTNDTALLREVDPLYYRQQPRLLEALQHSLEELVRIQQLTTLPTS